MRIERSSLNYLSLLVVVYALLLVWSSGFWRMIGKSEIVGEVKDRSTNFPLELVSVHLGKDLTYTNYQGIYRFVTDRKRPAEVVIDIPRQFEKETAFNSCQATESSKKSLSPVWGRLADRLSPRFSCQGGFYPRPFEMASRLVTAEAPQNIRDIKDRRERKKTIWGLMTTGSRALFLDEKDFVDLLMIKEDIEIKQGRYLLKAKVETEEAKLHDFFHDLTQKRYPEVAEVRLTRFFADEGEETVFELFAREEKVWRYLVNFDRRAIRSFIEKNKWVLSLPDKR